jgi:hypothetical protein
MTLLLVSLTGSQNSKETGLINEIGALEQEETNNEIVESTLNEESQEEVPSHNHNYVTNITKNSSCKEKGIETYTCECGDSYTKEIEMLQHVPSDWIIFSEATCSEEGKKIQKCTVCDIEISSEAIEKTNHIISNWIIEKEATCNSDGSKIKKCTVCNTEIDKETIKSDGKHNYYWDGDTQKRTHKCKGCNYIGVTEQNYNGVWGYFDEEKANIMFELANNARNCTGYYIFIDENGKQTKEKYKSLSMSNDLISYAKKRAIESILNNNLIENDLEWITKGYSNPYELENVWNKSVDKHANTFLTKKHTEVGIVCFMYDQKNNGVDFVPIFVYELEKK